MAGKQAKSPPSQSLAGGDDEFCRACTTSMRALHLFRYGASGHTRRPQAPERCHRRSSCRQSGPRQQSHSIRRDAVHADARRSTRYSDGAAFCISRSDDLPRVVDIHPAGNSPSCHQHPAQLHPTCRSTCSKTVAALPPRHPSRERLVAHCRLAQFPRSRPDSPNCLQPRQLFVAEGLAGPDLPPDPKVEARSRAPRAASSTSAPARGKADQPIPRSVSTFIAGRTAHQRRVQPFVGLPHRPWSRVRRVGQFDRQFADARVGEAAFREGWLYRICSASSSFLCI